MMYSLKMMLIFFLFCTANALTERLQVKGNRIYLSTSNVPWYGKGVNIPDNHACLPAGYCYRSSNEIKRRITNLFNTTNVNWIRFLLQFNVVNEIQYNNAYKNDIIDIIDHIGGFKQKYVELSLWISPSLCRVPCAHPSSCACDPNAPGGPSLATLQEWTYIAGLFKNLNHVIFGITNEPHAEHSSLPYPQNVMYMKNAFSNVVTKIRSIGANNLILVQCPLNFSRNCSYYLKHPIKDTLSNVAYEVHIFDHKDKIQSYLTLNLPLVLSETGPVNKPSDGNVEFYSDYTAIITYCKPNKIPYAGFAFDEICQPIMFSNSTLSIGINENCGANANLKNLTTWGKYFFNS